MGLLLVQSLVQLLYGMYKLWGDIMKIERITARSEGYVHCYSEIYTAKDILSFDLSYNFSKGINTLIGEIDSGNWGISYLLSMYKYSQEKFILFEQTMTTINDSIVSLDYLSKYSCYMDKIYPLFSTKSSVKEIVMQGIEKHKLNYSTNDIRDIFCIDNERFIRPLSGVGNEIFKSMAAIGYVHGKQIFCFPWLSKKRFDGYHCHMAGVLNALKSLEMIVILPIGE